ncbi:AAA family ATPase [Exiguobacterium sp.]|uniref:AAA family ATPase n=1 Tax=Exiguobacterium sp. TaxID=44751 RepID=UPI00289A225C|nr:AAA family ATPase [Exiguobacterium sp.]
MNDKIETILLEYLMGEGEIMTEEAIAIQEAEKRFYESLVIGSDMILTDGNRLINRRKRLWGVLKKKGYEELPHGLQVDLRWSREEEQVVVRIVLQCRYGSGTKKRYPTYEDLIRHSRLLRIPYLNEDGFHYVSESGIESPEALKKQVEHEPNKNIELVFIHHVDVRTGNQKKDLTQLLHEAIQRMVPSYEAILEAAPTIIMEQPPMITKHIEGGRHVHPKNMILQGPPGTGKTYHTVLYAVAIIEGKAISDIKQEDYIEVKKRYAKYRDENRIAFTTFHQSYGYEEFIEGIKPVIATDTNEIGFNIESGVFKEFCDLAAADHRFGGYDISIDGEARIWKVSLGGSGDRPLKKACFDKGVMRIGWDHFGEDPFNSTSTMNPSERSILTYFYDTMKTGDIVLSLKDERHIDGIGIIEGEVEWLEDEDRYQRSRKVNWLAQNISLDIHEMNMRKNLTQKTVYPLDRLSVSQVERMLEGEYGIPDINDQSEKPYVFIVDEINRGNISKILGELITLIEPSKRLGEMEETLVKLPYSKKEFGVPNNIYIIGTMNTADRSIALMDTALRRRFQFVEMSPDPQLLQGISIEGVHLKSVLDIMNRRIAALYDRDHMIGHAYFMSLSSTDKIDALQQVFLKSIIPLLQEYFFDDFGKINAIFGNDKTYPLLIQEVPAFDLFDSSINVRDLEVSYQVNHTVLKNPETYKAIYGKQYANA